MIRHAAGLDAKELAVLVDAKDGTYLFEVENKYKRKSHPVTVKPIMDDGTIGEREWTILFRFDRPVSSFFVLVVLLIYFGGNVGSVMDACAAGEIVYSDIEDMYVDTGIMHAYVERRYE